MQDGGLTWFLPVYVLRRLDDLQRLLMGEPEQIPEKDMIEFLGLVTSSRQSLIDDVKARDFRIFPV